MTCQDCKTDNLIAKSLQICWCQAELCAACMPKHLETCTAAARPASSPARDGERLKPKGMPKLHAQKGGFEAVMSVMKRIKRSR